MVPMIPKTLVVALFIVQLNGIRTGTEIPFTPPVDTFFLDFISVKLLLLSGGLLVLCGLISRELEDPEFTQIKLGALLGASGVIIMMLFSVSNVLYFYILLELLSVPIYFLILLFRGREEKPIAG